MKHFNRTRWRVLCPHNHVLKTTTTTGDIRELSSPRLVPSASWQSASCPVAVIATQPVHRLHIRPIVHNQGAPPTILASYIGVQKVGSELTPRVPVGWVRHRVAPCYSVSALTNSLSCMEGLTLYRTTLYTWTVDNDKLTYRYSKSSAFHTFLFFTSAAIYSVLVGYGAQKWASQLWPNGAKRLVGWLGFNGTFNTEQVISCLQVCRYILQ